MKPSHKYNLGILLIDLSVVFFLIAVFQVDPSFRLDAPCSNFNFAELQVPTSAKLAYCVNSNLMFSGTAFYGNGFSLANEVSLDLFSFKRTNQAVLVNGHKLQPQEIYRSFTWKPSINPWLIITRSSEIRNEGLFNSSIPDGVLTVVGDIHEGWYPNPLGLVILASGIWLYQKGRRGRNPSLQNLLPSPKTG